MKPFLSQLGIPPDKQSLSPTTVDFPPAFNPNNRLLWAEAVQCVKSTNDPGLDWGTAIKDYVRLCVSRDVFPFSQTKQTTNDLIYQKLMHARKAVVTFMNLSKIMDHVVFQKTDRKAVMTQTGFVISVFGLAKVQDPTFAAWLTQAPWPAFNVTPEGRWTKRLSRDVTFSVYSDYDIAGQQQWHVGYEISCSMFPEIPGHHLATKCDLEAFLMNVLWMPVLKSHRPYQYHRRLI